MRGTRFEVSTSGFDPTFQAIGTDQNHGSNYVGLRIPATPPTNGSRWLFMLAQARFGANRRARLVGIRQLITLIAAVPNEEEGTTYYVEKPIVTPTWHFSDANVSWSLRRVPLNPSVPNNPLNSASTSQTYSRTPALLYETGHTPGTYQPPAVQGSPLVPDLGTWHDLRFPWDSANAWHNSVDIEVEGPCDISLYASVKQSVSGTRATLIASPSAGLSEALPPEDQFLLLFTQAVYGRVAGSLIFEDPGMVSVPPTFHEHVRFGHDAEKGEG